MSVVIRRYEKRNRGGFAVDLLPPRLFVFLLLSFRPRGFTQSQHTTERDLFAPLADGGWFLSLTNFLPLL